mgnify:CR=1 FL=1
MMRFSDLSPSTQRNNRREFHAGFTLIEMVIVVAIIGILGALAIPSYFDQVRKSRRSMAQIALTELANRQELFFADTFAYTNVMANLSYPTTTVGGGFYTLAVTNVTVVPPGYTLTAQVDPAKGQVDDSNCKTFTLTDTGVKASTNSSNAASTGCWATGQ